MSNLSDVGNRLLSTYRDQSNVAATWVSLRLQNKGLSPTVQNVSLLLKDEEVLNGLETAGTQCGKAIALLGSKNQMLTIMNTANKVILMAGAGSLFQVKLLPRLSFENPQINQAIIGHVTTHIFSAAKQYINSLPAILMFGFASFLALGRNMNLSKNGTDELI